MAKYQVIAGFLVFVFATVVTATSEDGCSDICPLMYAPVCAFNGKVYKEFDNDCMLNGSNCRLEKSSAAKFVQVLKEWCSSEFVEDLYEKLGKPDLTSPKCMMPCPMIYEPVCVSNGIYRGVLPNECAMNTLNKCLGDKITALKVLRKGNC